MRDGRKEVNMSFPVITTERCQITIATANDTCWLHALLNDRDVYKYIEGGRPFAKTIESTTQFIDDMLYAYNNERGFLWKLLYKDNPIGFICIIDFDDTPSLSYGVVKAYRNKGFMSEALMRVLCYQAQLSNKTFQFSISKENEPSLNLYNEISRSFDTVLFLESN